MQSMTQRAFFIEKEKTSEQFLNVHDGTQIMTKTGEVFVEGVNIKVSEGLLHWS